MNKIDEIVRESRKFGIKDFSKFNGKDWALILNSGEIFFIKDKKNFMKKYKEFHSNEYFGVIK
jgi:hypothetical protein